MGAARRLSGLYCAAKARLTALAADTLVYSGVVHPWVGQKLLKCNEIKSLKADFTPFRNQRFREPAMCDFELCRTR